MVEEEKKKNLEETQRDRMGADGYKWLTKEIIIGVILISIGLLIIFNNILNIDLHFLGLCSGIFFLLGIWHHIRFFNNNEKLNYLILGHLFMLLSLFFADYMLCSTALNIYTFFILFQVMAVSVLAYTLRKDLNWLLVLSFVFLLVIALNVFSENFSLKLKDTVILWAIAIFFLYLYHLKRNMVLLALSVFFFVLGGHEIITVGDHIFEVLILWIIAGAFIYYYLKKPVHWWPIIPAGVLVLAGYEVINTRIFQIIPHRLTGTFWLLGIGGIFFVLWLLKEKYKDTGWAIWVALILWVIAAVVTLTEYLDAEIIIPLFFVLLGIWLIAKKVKPGRNT